MAEGDTILRLARRIDRALAGRSVAVRAPHPRGKAAGVERLDGSTLVAACARGKHLLITFRLPGPGEADRPEPAGRVREGAALEVVLHSHLGMSGGWHLYRPGERWRRPERSAWVVISATADRDPGGAGARGAQAGFDPRGAEAGIDPRGAEAALDLVQFGGPTLRLLRPEQARRDQTLSSLGPDILAAAPFDPAAAAASLREAGPEATLGEALLDQRRVAGIGNIFKSEGCFAARLDPWRPLGRITDDELSRVLDLTRAMMLASVEGAPRPRRVYRRAGEPCRRCGARIEARGQGEANRTTYWCPGCQG